MIVPTMDMLGQNLNRVVVASTSPSYRGKLELLVASASYGQSNFDNFDSVSFGAAHSVIHKRKKGFSI